MRPLVLHEFYSREEVHGIFSPTTRFTPQSGSWGMHGIVAIPDRPDDFVFFVTLGKKQGKHVFDEGVTEEGVLTWQSQPRQGFNDTKIQKFINHDEFSNSIYLFMRTQKDASYSYLGRLKYLSHDIERENPVYFQWQIIDSLPPNDFLDNIGTTRQVSSEKIVKSTPSEIGSLVKQDAPITTSKGGATTSTFRSRKSPDYSARDAKNRKLGLAGEKLVLRYEIHRLIEAGRRDLADKVRHISVIEGDGAGYDIESYGTDGTMRYIEVKTTQGYSQTQFYISSNEVAASIQHKSSYSLYRVYEYDDATDSGKFYEVRGDISSAFEMTPTNYRMKGPIRKTK